MASLCKKKGRGQRRRRGVTSRLCASEVGHRSEWNREPTPRGEERVCQRTRVARTRTGKYGGRAQSRAARRSGAFAPGKFRAFSFYLEGFGNFVQRGTRKGRGRPGKAGAAGGGKESGGGKKRLRREGRGFSGHFRPCVAAKPGDGSCRNRRRARMPIVRRLFRYDESRI